MRAHTKQRFRIATVVAVAGVLAVLVPAPQPAVAGTCSPVPWWVERHAVAIPEQSGRPGPDLAAMGSATRHADVVALGEAAHGVREVTELKARYLKYLVVHRGFRAIAWEEDWSFGTQINDYLHGSRDDVESLVAQMSMVWRTQQVRELLVWLRQYNDRHRDDVDFVGVEYYATRPLAYDAIEEHVARYAPDRLPALLDAFETHADGHEDLTLRPASDDLRTQVAEYIQVKDKTPYLQAAQDVVDIVTAVEGGSRSAREVVLHHTKQIRSFYVAFSLPFPDIPAYRDARAAENVAWTREHTDGKVLYWAAGAHAARVSPVTISYPDRAPDVFASVGSYLSKWYANRYVSIGFTFDHGASLGGEGEPVSLPAAPPEWFEAPLGEVGRTRFLLRLGGSAPDAVDEWLDRPLVTRGDPADGLASTMTGGTLREWYDVLVHQQEITPQTPLH